MDAGSKRSPEIIIALRDAFQNIQCRVERARLLPSCNRLGPSGERFESQRRHAKGVGEIERLHRAICIQNTHGLIARSERGVE